MTKPNNEDTFYSRILPEPNSGCWLWTGTYYNTGYGQIHIRGKQMLAHRFSAMISGREIEGRVVCHKCDVRGCVNPDHLVVADQRFNVIDAYDKGRYASGERKSQSKFTDEEAAAIFLSTKRTSELAAEHGVSDGTISKIRRGRSWTRVTRNVSPEPYDPDAPF